MDKTINDKLIYISNDDTQTYLFCRLKLLVEKFRTKYSKFSKSIQTNMTHILGIKLGVPEKFTIEYFPPPCTNYFQQPFHFMATFTCLKQGHYC